jgi:hypothetical protein
MIRVALRQKCMTLHSIISVESWDPNNKLIPFDITGRVGPCFANLLSGLDAPITEQEVHSAICSMLFGKSSGPDRYPAEFYKKFWGIIKADIMILVEAVHLQRVNISCLNKSKIMLIPKKDGASKIN